MNSASTQTKNLELSMDTLKSLVETWLRTTGEITDSQDVKLLTFATIANPTTVVEWESRKTVPLQLMLKREEVEVSNPWKNG